MKWEEEGYTRKDEHGNMISIVRIALPCRHRDVHSVWFGLNGHVGGV